MDRAGRPARLQGRDLPLAPQVHRRAGHAGRARRAPRAVPQPGARPSPGGGTVAYVNPSEHVYLDDIEHREEGGTPAIVESIRAGLVFQLKEAVGVEAIRGARALVHPTAPSTAWRRNPNIEILGNRDAERLSIVSFVVRHERPLPAPQLRRGAAQRPVRDPVARRLLVRRPVRPPPARHRPRASHEFEREIVARLRGHQAGLGPGQLQLLHQRGRLRVHPRRRRARRRRRLAAAAALPLRRRDRAVAARRPGRSRRSPWPTSATTADGHRSRPIAIARPSPAWPTTSPRHGRSWRIRRRRSRRPSRRPRRSSSVPTSRRCAGSGSHMRSWSARPSSAGRVAGCLPPAGEDRLPAEQAHADPQADHADGQHDEGPVIA